MIKVYFLYLVYSTTVSVGVVGMSVNVHMEKQEYVNNYPTLTECESGGNTMLNVKGAQSVGFDCIDGNITSNHPIVE